MQTLVRRRVFPATLAAGACLLLALYGGSATQSRAQAQTQAQTQAGRGMDDSSAQDLFGRVRTKVLDDISRIPNYTCVQTITRTVIRSATSRYRLCDQIIEDRSHAEDPRRGAHSLSPGSTSIQGLSSWERLRLEVAIAGKREVFSWVGASRFEEKSLQDLIGYGQTSTGDFGPFLYSVFFDHSSMQFDGETTSGGRRFYRFRYETPAIQSQYRLRAGPYQEVTAYSGIVLADPAAADIFRLTADSAPLAPASGYCRVENALDYGHVAIGGKEALIPLATRTAAIDLAGDTLLNESTYSGCREYVGESSLRFDEPESAPAASGAPPAEASALASIPAGLAFQARIVTLLDSETSAMGDPVEAVLRNRLRDRAGRTIAAAGARLQGRLTRFAMHPAVSRTSGASFEIGVQFLSVEVAGRPAALRALPGALAANASVMSVSPVTTADAENGVGRFVYKGVRLNLRQLDANWVTIAAK